MPGHGCIPRAGVATLEIYTGDQSAKATVIVESLDSDCFPAWPPVSPWNLRIVETYIDLCAELLLAVEINDPFHADIGPNLSKFIRNIPMKNVFFEVCDLLH